MGGYDLQAHLDEYGSEIYIYKAEKPSVHLSVYIPFGSFSYLMNNFTY